MDHNDLYVLDLTPSLKTLAMMVVNKHGLSTEVFEMPSWHTYIYLTIFVAQFCVSLNQAQIKT